MSEPEEEATVTVTSKGQATIPKRFRDKLQIDAPGRVRFVETEDGEIVVRPVKRPSDLRGELASDDAEKPATELLREERRRDKEMTDKTHGVGEREE